MVPEQAAEAEAGFPVVILFRTAADSQLLVGVDIMEAKGSLAPEVRCSSGGSLEKEAACGGHGRGLEKISPGDDAGGGKRLGKNAGIWITHRQ